MQNKQKMRKVERGAAAVELALLAPFLGFLMLVAAELGWLMASSVMVMNAASSGARFFANQRGTPTPYTDTNTQIKASSAYLNASSLSFSASVGNTSCSADDTCALDLSNGVKNGAVTSASVTVIYPYQPLTHGSLFGLTNAFPKSLSATAVERVL